MKRSVLTLFAAAVTAVAVVACNSDHVAAPTPSAAPVAAAPGGPSGSLLGGLLGGTTSLVGGVVNTVTDILAVDELLPVLKRRQSLDHDVTWTFVAGPWGATSRNPETGLTIVIPRGALSQNTTITVKAPAGDVMAYQFEPHGLQFAKPVELRQDLTLADLTALLGLTKITGAYYASPTLDYDPAAGTAHVDELEPTSVDLLSLSTTIDIRHFSGYIVACGRSAR
jgi:hypothetical protein